MMRRRKNRHVLLMTMASMAAGGWVSLACWGCPKPKPEPKPESECPSRSLAMACVPKETAGEAKSQHLTAASQLATTAPAAATRIDPLRFCQDLIRRYQGLSDYRDTTKVVQVTQRRGEGPSRVESSINCQITAGKLKVQSPNSQMREATGLNLPLHSTQAMRDLQMKYDLWLAPHMAMKFADKPLKNLRAGVEEGFTATQAESVTINDKPMVHVELRSGDGLSQDCAAKFDLFVNAESMLIERIDGEQRLPDGASYVTSLEISPENPSKPAPPPPDVPDPAEPVDAPARLSPAA